MNSKDLEVRESEAYDAQYRDLKAVSVAQLALLDAQDAYKKSLDIYQKYQRVVLLTEELGKLEEKDG